jgi:hypothetical protein
VGGLDGEQSVSDIRSGHAVLDVYITPYSGSHVGYGVITDGDVAPPMVLMRLLRK